MNYMNVRIATYTSGYIEITLLPFLRAVHYAIARRPQWEKNAILLNRLFAFNDIFARVFRP